MVRRTAFLVVIVVLAGCVGAVPDTGTTPASGDGVPARVTAVVDGDTVKVAFDNGTRETVRLLGVDTPEVHVENTPDEYEGVPETDAGRQCLRSYGERASDYAETRLDGEGVTLVFDPLSDRRGSYGRLLAYVVVDGEQFNYALLTEGYARLYDSEFAERDRYAAAETNARDARRGLWSCADATATPAGGGGPLAVDAHPDAEGNDNENLNDEYVTFTNVGDEPLNLTGWTVSDAADKSYAFGPGTTLDPGASLTLYTGSGTDTATERYWGREGAVWNNGGDTLTVRDESGSTVLQRDI